MKRFCPFLLALLAALALAAPTYAYRDADFDGLPFDGADSGAVTVITDTQGAVHRYDGALDAAAPDEYPAVAAKIASYAIELDGETLLRVELRDFEAASERRAPLLGATASVLTNGFYAVTFDYDADYECFVTGLNSDQVDELTDALIGAELAFQSIDVGTLSFIDAEKLATVEPTDTLRYSNDSKVCWAATTANLLRYTGWAKRAHELYGQVADDEDALLDLFTQNFEDGFGNVYYGMTWFFNGRYAPDDYPGEFDPAVWAHKKENAAGGDYLPYPAEDYLRDVEVINNEASIRDMAQSLRDGDGVGISLGWYEEDAETGGCVRTGGHAVTLWGYIRLKDEDSLAFDAGNYVALLTTDSDSDPVNNRITRKNQWSDDRTQAPDCLMLMPLTARTLNVGDAETPREEASWQVTATGGSNPQLGMLTNYAVLKAYKDIYKMDDGSFDSNTSPDLRADMLYIGEYDWERPSFEEKTGTERAVFTANRELLVYLKAASVGRDYTTNSFVCSAELLRPGQEEFEDLGSIPCAIDKWGWVVSAADGYSWPCMILDGLEAGSYTIRLTVSENSQTPTREAFYYNNSIEMHFTVAEPVYDLSGVSLAIAGATQDAGTDSVGNPLYGLPLALTGLDTAGVRLTGCYAAAEHLWYDPDTDSLYWEAARSVQDCGAIAEPEPVLLYGASRVRVRMLLKPADDKTPWSVVEREIALLDRPAFREETDEAGYYYYIGAKCSLLERTIEPWSSWPDSAVYVAGYDRDGRLLFFTRSQSGAGAAVAFDEAVRTLRLFWVGTDGKPQGVPIDVEV